MCLNKVIPKEEWTCPDEGEAYQIRMRGTYNLYADLCCKKVDGYKSIFFHSVLPVDGSWIMTDNLENLYSSSNKPYKCGFHLLTTKEDAKLYQNDCMKQVMEGIKIDIIKVKYKNKVAEGYQMVEVSEFEEDDETIDVKTIVAQDIAFIETV